MNVEPSEIEYPEYAVKNTFIEFPARRNFSLEGFLQERETQSEPGSKIMIQRLESLEEEFGTIWGPSSKKAQDNMSNKTDYIVRNTFIEQEVDVPALRTWSLEEFLKDRETQSCPGSGIAQRLESLEEEPTRLEPIPSARVHVPSSSPPQSAFPEVASKRCPTPALEQRQVSLESPEPLPDTPIAFPSTPVDFPAVAIEGLSLENLGLLQGLETNFMTGPEQDIFNTSSACSATSTVPEEDPRHAVSPPSTDGAHENPTVINLSQQLGVWSVGSIGHEVGYCKPCAFLWKDGCKDGASCDFCHICPPGEQKRRKKEKHAWRKAVRVARSGMRFGPKFGGMF